MNKPSQHLNKSSQHFIASLTPPPTLNFKNDKLLSEYTFTTPSFPDIDTIIPSFRQNDFLSLSYRKRFKKINQTLCQLILDAPPHSFLLSAVLDYLERVNGETVLGEPLNFAGFEFWLNNFSNLSEHDNYLVRAKIAGKFIPRSSYQGFFPIGMDRFFAGTHFVAAHLSPDIDTMIASFWGWLDAFAARIGTGIHLWCLPGGPPNSPITSIFRETIGKGTFTYLARTSQTLTLTAMDLVNQQKLTKQLGNILTSEIDHGLSEKAVIMVNEQGHYLGDWHISDIEQVRQIIILFKSCLRWFENTVHTKLISLFAKKDLSVKDLPDFYSAIFDVKIKNCEPALEFNEQQKQSLNDFFYKVLKIEKGMEGTFRDLNDALNRLSMPQMLEFQQKVEALSESDIFDSEGKLQENRPKIFHHLENIINDLDEVIHYVRNYVERLDVVLEIKYKVLGLPLLYTTLRSDVDEIRYKMQNYDFLTVVIQEQDNSLFPVGVVRANDLRKSALGTVTLRDFCNQEEVKMASYLEVISVVDHHKSTLKTLSVPAALIGDTQSCNVLIAEQNFLINDRYSLGGLTKEAIEKEIQEISLLPPSPSHTRILQRLLQRRIAGHQGSNTFYIHPQREFQEYLFFLHAILDDTDLLTKVSSRDIDCVIQLLNRLKSLSVGHEVEIVSLDDLPRDKSFAKIAAQRILQQPDMYSLYKQIYDFRELEVESNLELCLQGEVSPIFLDTKEQNGCARVGQTKMFASNFKYFSKHVNQIRKIWLKQSLEVYQDRPEIDFYLHMISTIASADEVYANCVGNYSHEDEIWIWTPPTQQASDHLATFLAGFQSVVKNIKDHNMHIEFMGPNGEEYAKVFIQNFFSIPVQITEQSDYDLPFIVLRFRAGTLNSRKSMITPFLPRLIG